jgi:hypothetical protein
MSSSTDSAVGNGRHEETRRALLAKASLVGGAMGLATLAGADRASGAVLTTDNAITANNVKNSTWGAVGDGVTDDRQAIQNCINDSAGQAAVYFPQGTYRLLSAGTGNAGPLLTLPAKTRLIGQGMSRSVLKADVPTTPATTVSTVLQSPNSGDSDISIEDLTIDVDSKSRLYGIQIAGTVDAQRKHIFIRRVEVMHHEYVYPSYVVRLDYLAESAIEDCWIHDAKRDGIDVLQGDAVVVRGNLVERCGDDHIVARGLSSGRGITVTGNIVNATTTTRGAAIAPGSRVTVVGNVCIGGIRGNIEVRTPAGSDAAHVVEDLVIADNVLLEAGNSSGTARSDGLKWGPSRGSAISILNDQSAPTDGVIRRVSITDNSIYAPRNHAVVLTAQDGRPISDIAISGNIVWMGDPTNLLGAWGDSTNPILRSGAAVNSDLLDNRPSGPITEIRITDNEIRLAKGGGVSILADTGDANCKRWDIRSNTIYDSGASGGNQPGILLDHVRDFMVVGNRAQDTRGTKYQDYGIKITNATGKSLVADNCCLDNVNSQGINPHGPVTGPPVWIKDNVGDDLA